MSNNISFLDDDQNAAVIRNFREIVGTCIGPRGWFKVFQTVQGGFALLSTTSSRIFNSLSVERPVLQIFMAGLKSHSQLYGDGGLFLAGLGTSLYLEHIESKLPRQLCIRVNDYICHKAMELLNQNKLSYKLDVGKLSHMSIPVKSVLTSKPVCHLSVQEVDHLSVLILKAFYNSLSPGNIDDAGINILSCEGPSALESDLVKGILLPLPYLDIHGSRLLTSLNLKVKVAVFTMSLSGHQTVFSEKTSVDEQAKASLNNVMSGELLRICESIVRFDIKLVLCQKVVHPSIRKYLNKHDVLLCERLGSQPIKFLCSKLKLRQIESAFMEINQSHFGEAEDVKLVELHGKRYLAVHPVAEQCEVFTMMLCANEESQLDELKICVQTAEKMLFHMIKEPRVLCGAGCFETQIAKLLRDIGENECNNMEQEFQHASRAQLQAAVNSIAKSFESIAKSVQRDMGDYYTDTSYGHFWCFPKNISPKTYINKDFTCCCGFVNYRPYLQFQSLMFKGINEAAHQDIPNEAACTRDLPAIADSLVTKRESIATAFELCNVILRINASMEG